MDYHQNSQEERPLVGQTVSHYRILKKIGQGGMGTVYLAQDFRLGRKVALKFLSHPEKADEAAIRRLTREAKSAAALDHPFICEVHEIGEHGDQIFIAMEYVEGETLRDRLRRGPIPLTEGLRLIQEVSEALEVAHSRGIIHRDLKPANIMITPQGHAKVMDFGLAKRIVLDDEENDEEMEEVQETISSTITLEGQVVGTPSYMSPEQVRGENLDGRSDLFSLGVVLEEILTGENPFSKGDIIKTLGSILCNHPDYRYSKLKKLSQPVSAVQRRLLAKEPSDRFQDSATLTGEIEAIREQLISREKVGTVWRLASAVGIILIVLLIALWFSSIWLRESPQAPSERITALIADFENSTEEEVFDGVAEQALWIGLEAHPSIDLFNRDEAGRVAKEIDPPNSSDPEPKLLDFDLAQLVALREGIDLVVGGSVGVTGNNYSIETSVVEVGSGETLFHQKDSFEEKDEVLAVMPEVSRRVRKELGDVSLGSKEDAVPETVTTSSLESAHYYGLGRKALWNSQDREAIEHFDRALQYDPDLGRAYSGLGNAYRNLGEEDKAKSYFEEAMARIDRMSPREKYRTRGSFFVLAGDYERASQEFSGLVTEFPGDKAGRNNLAVTSFYSHDMEGAFEQIGIALEMEPTNPTMRYNFAFFSSYAGEFEQSIEVLEPLLKEKPELRTGFVTLASCYLGLERLGDAKRMYRNLAATGQEGASMAEEGLADIEAALGLYESAAERLQQSINETPQGSASDVVARRKTFLASLFCILGRNSDARNLAFEALESSSEERIKLEGARTLIELGEEGAVQELSEELLSQLTPEPQVFGQLIHGDLWLKQKMFRQALEAFQKAQKLRDKWLVHYYLGRTYLEVGHYSHAHAEFETCLQRKGEALRVFLDDGSLTYRYLPAVYYYFGRAQEGVRSPRALESYQKFLSICGQGFETDLVKDAQTRVEALQIR